MKSNKQLTFVRAGLFTEAEVEARVKEMGTANNCSSRLKTIQYTRLCTIGQRKSDLPSIQESLNITKTK